MPKSVNATNAQRGFLKRFGHVVRQLPEPEEHWLCREVDIDNLESVLNVLNANGAITRVGQVYRKDCGEHISVWQTCAHVYQLAHSDAHSRGDTGILPCGHDAIQNKRGVDGITCGVCESVHDRSEVDA